ncbi:MAG TPA: TIGR01777 family oxidoreductase [Pirellulales bacterium]|nr:TIGR01777 family oxidoreductase [Pirellulales bacterium]
MRALVTGATGFIGRRLLESIDDPVVLSRNPERSKAMLDGASLYRWDPTEGPPPLEALEGVEAVFHLAGDPVAGGRWTDEKKRRVRDSRVVGTQNLVRAIADSRNKPRVLVSASAIGYYGSRGDEVLSESSSPGSDFLADVCVGWERAAQGARELGVRVVNPRIGIVLGQRGGALSQMLTPFRLGLGGRLGHGRQWMSWIHLKDVVGLLLLAATQESIVGPMNVVSPAPVTNREFTQTLAGVLHRPAVFPVPAIALRIMIGGFSEVLLGSQRVLPVVAQSADYPFEYASLRAALLAAVEEETPA